ncbi:hypothetical protein EYR41_000377 [Orbilia oligospora]|uniref:Pet127-domain-containing protein n=1 Tax=Orbilia oligospora TaxID=2813651 RepID=A0A8H2ECF0_ORBOL|nr:hypothetical protein EYR41_000377 [Orbilia oligospora]
MLRMRASLTRAGSRPFMNQRSPWICRTCRIHQSASLLLPKNDGESFPQQGVTFKAIGKRKKGALPMEDTMTPVEREKVVEKMRIKHTKFIEKLQEYIRIRKKMAEKLKKDAEHKKKNKTKETGGPKTASVVAKTEENRVKRAQEICEAAKLFSVTPHTWPSVNRLAITSDNLLLMHTAMKETMQKMEVEKGKPSSWLEASTQRAKNDALYYPLMGGAGPLYGSMTGKANIEVDSGDRTNTNDQPTEGEPTNPLLESTNEANGEASSKTIEDSGGKELENQEQGTSENSGKEEKKPRKSAREKKLEVDATTITAKDFQLEPIDLEQNVELRPLSHGLDRVLFNPGVTFLRDPRSRVYNFDPYLDSIMPVDEFDFDALGDYVTSSKDTTLIDLARRSQKKYVGSTSSMTAILSHLHYLLSRWRPINVKMLSKGFVAESENFTRLSRLPVSVILRWKDGIYAIDQDKEADSMETILLFLGRSMEKMLTLPPEVFQKYHKSASHEIPDEVKNARERYHYTGFGDLLFRSQLDAHDDRLPGTGVFDLKTRGVISIRMNAAEPATGWGYQIKTADGQFESFEREYYDLIRSAFMKYSLQVRMGRMDGCFVAYHNTKRIFGFQYISIDEMDEALHGSPEVGDQEFKLSLKLLNEALDKATEKYPEQSLRLWFETRESAMPFLYFSAEPITEEEVLASQERGADLNVVLKQIKKSSRPPGLDGMGPRRNEPAVQKSEPEMEEATLEETTVGETVEETVEEIVEETAMEETAVEETTVEKTPTEAATAELIEKGEEEARDTLSALQEGTEMLESVTIEGEKLIDPVRDARLLAEGKSGWEYLAAPKTENSTNGSVDPVAEESAGSDNESTSTTEQIAENSATDDAAETAAADGPFVQVLVAQSTVNGEKVDRPTTLNAKDVWSVNYAFLEMDNKAATKTLGQIKRRKKEGIEYDANWKSTFMQHLKKLSLQGERYAAQQRKEDEEGDIVVYRSRS